jgi:RNA polymerase sigma-70 factor (ECF subfamily)
MTNDNSFNDFIRRIRAGDAEAARQLIKQYEPVVRLEVRMRLGDPRLGRVLDSMDICQSVMASFFVRAAGGQYDLHQPQDLVKLLVVMARNKVAFQARKQRAQRRDVRRTEAVSAEAFEAAAAGPSPSQVVAGKELLEQFRLRLTAEERQIADRRALGKEWAEIATELGGTAQGRRKQLERAIARVSQQLGLEEDDQV